MPRNAILHIGPMKTGSTSIQLWLHQRAANLSEQGYHVVASLGGRNHSRLAFLAQSRAFGRELSPGDQTRLAALGEEVAGLDPSIHTVILSGEMIGQTLNNAAEIQALKDLLDPMFDRFTVIVYLRRQDELSLSRYSTALRRGEKRARPLIHPIDYDLLLSLWSTVFGRENIRPRMFTRDALVGGDAVRDFAQTAALPYEPAEEAPIDRNPSLLPQAQGFLADLAQRVRSAGYEGQFTTVEQHEDINRILNEHFAGKGVRPARAEVTAFYDLVRASNERVRAAWFPERETLFPEDFTSYPIDGPPEIDPAERLEVAMAVLTGLILPKRAGGRTEKMEDREAMIEIRREKRRLRKLSETGAGERSAEETPKAQRQAERRAERNNRI